jgi:hypothetical protein
MGVAAYFVCGLAAELLLWHTQVRAFGVNVMVLYSAAPIAEY